MITLPTLLLSLSASGARACGQSTHVWIGIEAVDFLPPGELRDLLTEPSRFDLRVLGAMFPDGGYGPLSRDGYGETAHWPPFQDAYLDWIVETYDPPYTGEAADHVAFLMGLAAHGMADQVYDGVYLTRALVYDGEERFDEVDYATDVAMVSIVGPMPPVQDRVPYDVLDLVFDRRGQDADPATMQRGTAQLQLAVGYIGALGSDPALAAPWVELFPWANRHLDDPTVPCSPACIQPAVAAYWQTLWDRLHGRFDADAHAVFWTWPEDGGYGVDVDPMSLESQVHVAFSRATDADSVTLDRIVVTDPDGVAQRVGARLYYGDNTNVLNVWPEDGWAPDTRYTLTVKAGLTSWTGEQTGADWSFTFSTGDRPADPGPQTPAQAAGDGRVDPCSCASGSAPTGWWGVAALAALLRRRR